MNRIQAVDPCLDDAALLALAVGDENSCDEGSRGHLRSCPDCSRRLKETLTDIAPFLKSFGSDVPRDPRLLKPLPVQGAPPPVERVGRFEIIDTLGRGGQAAVYLAKHPTLKTDVVLKVGHLPIRDAVDGESSAQAEDDDYLVREGRLLKQLHHPNLAQVHDLEYVEDERTGERRPVLVMEYVRGRPLRDVAKERKFSPREAAHLIAKIARAASAAHAVGVFHRDITPANIVLDERGEPRLIDFGLARYRHAWGEHAEPVGPEYGSGTRGFRAPEQAEGRNDDINARTDVYGLGAVLQHLLLGGKSAPTLAIKSTGGGGEAFGADRERLQKAGVGSALCRVVERAMQPEQQDRYQSAHDLAVALDRAVRPARWPRYLGAIAAAAMVLVAIKLTSTPPPVPVGPQPVLVNKNKSALEDALPLRHWIPASLRVNVPRDAAAVLMQIDPNGDLELHDDLVRTRADGATLDTMTYWDSGFGFAPTDPAGTKVFLVVALKHKTPDKAEIEKLQQIVRTVVKSGWVPDFGPDTHAYSRLWPDGVDDIRAKPERTTFVPPPSTSQQLVDAQLQRLRTALRDGGWTSFAGIAVPYEP